MKIYIEDILNSDFIAYFHLTLVFIFLFVVLMKRIYRVLRKFRSPVIFATLLLMVLLTYNISKDCIRELSYRNRFYSESILDICAWIMLEDAGIWIFTKFIESYASRNIYKKSENNNPKNLKREIESMISKESFNGSPEMMNLYETLQLNLLSIQKQEKLIISSLFNNLIVSLLFFVLGLIIPKIIVFISNYFVSV